MRKAKIKILSIVTAVALFAGVGVVYGVESKNNDKENVSEVKKSETLNPARRATFWFQYDGSGSSTDPSSYTLMSPQPASDAAASALCPGNNQVCVIKATADENDSPEIDETLSSQIENAQSSHQESGTVKLRQ